MKILLTPFQKKFLKAFGKTDLAKHFYWSGGTLLSYFYLHHRFSEDLDFFSRELFFDEYIASQLLILKKLTGTRRVEEQKRLNRHQFLFQHGKESLKIELVYYPFPSLEKHKKLKEFGITIDSLKDIAVNKIHAAFERSEPKDVFDLYWIIKRCGFRLKNLISLVEKKFGTVIDFASLSAKILDGISSLKKIRPFMMNPKMFQPKRMKDFFEKEALMYLKRKLSCKPKST